MTRFQTIFLGILILLGVGGAILFATARNDGSESVPQLVMWGSERSDLMSALLSKVSLQYSKSMNVTYVEKNPQTFESDLISALARGQGPDLVLLPQDLLIKQLDKFYIIPFESFSARTFRDSYIQEGELFLLPDRGEVPGGIAALPFSIDPLVMYWNRDMFTNEGIALPPTAWTDFFSLVPKFTEKDANGNITRSGIAFGEVRNVSHAKDVLALLSMQAGTPIVARNANGSLSSALGMRGTDNIPAEAALSYFTEFANPTKPSYSWNRALSNDRALFIGGRLAVYFGYASELFDIRSANENLNFDVAMVPQAFGGKKMTFGEMQGVAILKSSLNIPAAYLAAGILSNSTVAGAWAEVSGLPPARRDLIAALPGDPYKAVFYQSALVANAWLDPYREASDGIFMRMVENVTSGKLRVSEAVSQASSEINNLLSGI